MGKTTTCVNLSSYLALMGKRVLCVDIDPQGNCSSGFGIDKSTVKYSTYSILTGEVDAKTAIVPTVVKNLDIIPANIDLAGAEVELVSIEDREKVLKKMLTPLRNVYDYICIDCPPSARAFNGKRAYRGKQHTNPHSGRVLCARRAQPTDEHHQTREEVPQPHSRSRGRRAYDVRQPLPPRPERNGRNSQILRQKGFRDKDTAQYPPRRGARVTVCPLCFSSRNAPVRSRTKRLRKNFLPATEILLTV